MAEIKLDDIPELVSSKQMSLQQACIEVYLILYMNPARFNLQGMDEDTRSDFLLFFLERKIEKLIKIFNPQISEFGAYIYATLQPAKFTYLHNIENKKIDYNNLVQDSIYDYHEKIIQNYESVTKLSEVAESEPSYGKPALEESFNKDSKKIPELMFYPIFKKLHGRMDSLQSRKIIYERGILILALKSAWYISDDHIKKVSRLCKIPEQVLVNSVCRLKAKLISKALNRQTIEQNRNRAYKFVSNYRYQLKNNPEKAGTIKFRQLERRLDYQYKNWMAKNLCLKSGRFKIAPTNHEIAEVVGLSYKHVSHYLRRFRQLFKSAR